MNRETLSLPDQNPEGFDLHYVPACWHGEIEAARQMTQGSAHDERPHPCPSPLPVACDRASSERLDRERSSGGGRIAGRAPFCLSEAWENVGDLYAWIVSLFGAPAAIAGRLILMRQKRRDILAWLGPVEALARRLLLLKAITLPKPNAAPPRSARGRVLIAFTDRPIADIDPDAQSWRVRFCVMPYGALRRKADRKHLAGEPAGSRRSAIAFNALPLARRLEALRRVLENPAPALARLARLIAHARPAIEAAFRPYRPPATCVQSLLPAAQSEVALALNTS